MRRTLIGIVAVWLVASAALTAADFWQEKDFTAWTAQQVEKMLTDSPWARRVTVVIGSLREGALDSFQGGDAGLGGGGGRNSEGSTQVQGIRRVTVTVAWISGLPARQALVRLQSGLGAAIPPDLQRELKMLQDQREVLQGELAKLRDQLGKLKEANSEQAKAAETRQRRSWIISPPA